MCYVITWTIKEKFTYVRTEGFKPGFLKNPESCDKLTGLQEISRTDKLLFVFIYFS